MEIEIELEQYVIDYLEDLARRQKRTVNDVVMDILREYLDNIKDSSIE